MSVSIKKMEEIIGIIILVGMLISAFFVVLGGILFLAKFGNMTLENSLVSSGQFHVGFAEMWSLLKNMSPIGIIEIGLILLIATQILRVALLCCFYAINHDYPFTLISLFILLVLIYSSIWQP